MGQPTQRATNYTARSNIDTAQIFLHANGQRPKRAMIRQRSRRRQRRGEPLGVLPTSLTQQDLRLLFTVSADKAEALDLGGEALVLAAARGEERASHALCLAGSPMA